MGMALAEITASTMPNDECRDRSFNVEIITQIGSAADTIEIRADSSTGTSHRDRTQSDRQITKRADRLGIRRYRGDAVGFGSFAPS